MDKPGLLKIATFIFVVSAVGLLYVLTLHEEDPCKNPQQDITGAVLAEDGDQGGLVNRAIIMRGVCKEPTDPE